MTILMMLHKHGINIRLTHIQLIYPLDAYVILRKRERERTNLFQTIKSIIVEK